MVGNHHPTPVFGNSPPLEPITLRDLLKQMGEYGNYAGMNRDANLSNDELDCQVSIRFQTTFLPTDSPFRNNTNNKESVEFATEAYNYQTRDENNPKNLILLCTTQGVAVQQDGSNKTRLYHHTVNSDGSRVGRHWLEAERTAHTVGGEQHESEEEKIEALSRGKAIATVIGPQALGTRFNCLMTVQVPLKQESTKSPFGNTTGFDSAYFGSAPASAPSLYYSSTPTPAPEMLVGGFGAAPPVTAPQMMCAKREGAGGGLGISSAARVSRGTEYDNLEGKSLLKAKSFTRHESERITATIVLYNVVVGGVPTEADVLAAIDDLEQLYAACSSIPRQNTNQFNDGNQQKSTWPPPVTVTSSVINGGTFPEPKPPNVLPNTSPLTNTFSPYSQISKSILDVATKLPMTMESYTYLDGMGQHLLSDKSATQSKLFESYGYFRLTNEMSIQQKGHGDATSLYNIACCCSRLADQNLTTSASSLFIHPPVIIPNWIQSKEMCLDASISWLLQGVCAGWNNHEHMMVDLDLEIVRSQRFAKFSIAVNLAKSGTL